MTSNNDGTARTLYIHEKKSEDNCVSLCELLEQHGIYEKVVNIVQKFVYELYPNLNDDCRILFDELYGEKKLMQCQLNFASQYDKNTECGSESSHKDMVPFCSIILALEGDHELDGDETCLQLQISGFKTFKPIRLADNIYTIIKRNRHQIPLCKRRVRFTRRLHNGI
jgi:hypothetical protein